MQWFRLFEIIKIIEWKWWQSNEINAMISILRSNQSHGMEMVESKEINAMISIIRNNQSHGIKMMPK